MIERLVAILFPASSDQGIDWRADAIALWQLQRSDASSPRARALLDLQIVSHALHERACQRWSQVGKSPGALARTFIASGHFVESAAGLSGPVDDPREEALAVVALGHIGVPDRQARSDVRRYLRRVRAAVAPVRHVSVAGVLAAAAFTLGLAAALGAISVTLAIVVGVGQIDRPYYVTDGRTVAEVRRAAQSVDHDQTSPLPTMVPVSGRGRRGSWPGRRTRGAKPLAPQRGAPHVSRPDARWRPQVGDRARYRNGHCRHLAGRAVGVRRRRHRARLRGYRARRAASRSGGANGLCADLRLDIAACLSSRRRGLRPSASRASLPQPGEQRRVAVGALPLEFAGGRLFALFANGLSEAGRVSEGRYDFDAVPLNQFETDARCIGA